MRERPIDLTNPRASADKPGNRGEFLRTSPTMPTISEAVDHALYQTEAAGYACQQPVYMGLPRLRAVSDTLTNPRSSAETPRYRRLLRPKSEKALPTISEPP